jgi:DNA-binding MarR family transcriptional regulator
VPRPNTVSTQVKELVSVGLVDRGPRATDRRCYHLTLTSKAEALLTTWRDRRAELVAAAIADLTPSDRLALASSVPALRRLVASLDQS